LVAGWPGLLLNSDKVALAASRAKPADETEYRRYHNLVEGLVIAAGLPKPRLYVVDDPAPNAFATGRNPKHAAIAVTTGLLDTMNRVELEGVLAHELSHVKNYDILVTTIAVIAVGAIALLADIGLRVLGRAERLATRQQRLRRSRRHRRAARTCAPRARALRRLRDAVCDEPQP
jgi:Zn-dependent protease with chaperone function